MFLPAFPRPGGNIPGGNPPGPSPNPRPGENPAWFRRGGGETGCGGSEGS